MREWQLQDAKNRFQRVGPLRTRGRTADSDGPRQASRSGALCRRLYRADHATPLAHRLSAIRTGVVRRVGRPGQRPRTRYRPRYRALSYLVDTCVVSEARRRSTPAIAWLNAVDPAALFLSVITIGEIAKGIAARERTDPVAAAALVRWLDGLRTNYADRILSIDDDVAIAWGTRWHGGHFPFRTGSSQRPRGCTI